jgi:hypothetical protein
MACALGPLRCAQAVFFFSLEYYGKETRDNPEQCDTFYEGCSQDHVCTDVTRSFRLTGDAFYGTLTDLTDAYTSAQCSETCTYSAKTSADTNAFLCYYWYCSCSLQENCV